MKIRLNLFRRKPAPAPIPEPPAPAKWLKESDYPVEHAFTAGGVDYFRIVNPFNQSCHRAFAGLAFYEEMQMKTSLQYLEGLYAALETHLNSGELVKASALVSMAKERLTWAYDPDLIYKLASVMFFDANESPIKYDHQYNRAKIARWKQLDLEDFFLQRPLLSLIPSLEGLGTDLETFTKGARIKNEKLITSILNTLASDSTKGTIVEALTIHRDELRTWLE